MTGDPVRLVEGLWVQHCADIGQFMYFADFNEAINETLERCATIVRLYTGFGPAASEAANAIRALKTIQIDPKLTQKAKTEF